MEEVRVQFLMLVAAFDPQRGVLFPLYIQEKLPQRLAHSVRDERRYQAREVCCTELADEEDEAEEFIERLALSHAGQDAFDEVLLQVWLEEELAKLSEAHREVFRLFWEGWTTEEIAVKMGKSPTRVHQLKAEARAWLKEVWKKSCEED